MKDSCIFEFKREVTSTFLKTVSAFANFGGGTFMFGVDDSGRTLGTSEPEQLYSELDMQNNTEGPKFYFTMFGRRSACVPSVENPRGRYWLNLYCNGYAL